MNVQNTMDKAVIICIGNDGDSTPVYSTIIRPHSEQCIAFAFTKISIGEWQQ